MVTPNFISNDSAARDNSAGIAIVLSGTQDLETIRIYFEDERHGTKFSFYGAHLARDEDGNPTTCLGANRRLCGYEGMGSIGKFVASSPHSLEDIRTYVSEGLRVIASNRLKIPKDQVVIQVKLTA